LKVRAKVMPDCFVDQDKPEAMYQKAGLSAAGIVETGREALQINSGAGVLERARR
jgi:1-deoxy-D-xylulose-5-phosphate synthase